LYPYDSRNIPAKFSVIINKFSLSNTVDARPFTPFKFSLSVPRKEFVDSITFVNSGPDSTIIYRMNSDFQGTLIYSDTGLFIITARIFVSDYNASVFDTSFSVRVSSDLYYKSIKGFVGDTTLLIAKSSKPSDVFYVWRIKENDFKTLNDTVKFVFTDSLNDSIDLLLENASGQKTTPYKVPVHIEKLPFYTVAFTKYGQGTIQPPLPLITMKKGTDTTIILKPARNYSIDSVVVNDINSGNDSVVMIKSINTDKKVSIYFGKLDTILPKIAILYPSDSSIISSSILGYDINKLMKKIEVRWISMPYGVYDSLSPHIFSVDSIQNFPGIHQVNSALPLVNGGVYTLQITATDTVGNSAIIAKSNRITYRIPQ
jgi:hypothetical protein